MQKEKERMGKVETKGWKIFMWVNIIAMILALLILFTHDDPSPAISNLELALFIIVGVCCINSFICAIVDGQKQKEKSKKASEELWQMAFQAARNNPSSFVNPVINENQLRRDLQNYYGTAAYNGFPAAAMDAMRVDKMSTQELVNQAQKNGFDMSKYTH